MGRLLLLRALVLALLLVLVRLWVVRTGPELIPTPPSITASMNIDLGPFGRVKCTFNLAQTSKTSR